MPKAYCVKCRKSREMKNFKEVTSNKRKMLGGVCSKCGTKMNKFI